MINMVTRWEPYLLSSAVWANQLSLCFAMRRTRTRLTNKTEKYYYGYKMHNETDINQNARINRN